MQDENGLLLQCAFVPYWYPNPHKPAAHSTRSDVGFSVSHTLNHQLRSVYEYALLQMNHDN